jgi:hypothetical protein
MMNRVMHFIPDEWSQASRCGIRRGSFDGRFHIKRGVTCKRCRRLLKMKPLALLRGRRRAHDE